MKNAIFLLFISLLAVEVSAQDKGLYWKYKDYDGAVSVTAPEFLLEMGSWFINDQNERQMFRKINKVRVLVFSDGQNPIKERDMRKFFRKAKRRHLEELVAVRDGKTRVSVMGQEKRNSLRKVVVLVNTPDEFVLVGIKGRLNLEDVSKIANKYSKKSGSKNEVSPDVIKIPTKRV
jgi:hypothetical protein